MGGHPPKGNVLMQMPPLFANDVGWRRMSKEKLQTAVHYRSKGGKRCWTGSKHLKSTEYLCSKCGFYFKNILEPRIPFFFGV